MRGKWIWRLIGASAVLFIGCAVYLKVVYSQDKLLELVLPSLQEALGRPIKIDQASLRTWPFALHLEHIVIAESTEPNAAQLLRIGTIDLDVQLLPLMRRRVVVRALDIREAEIFLRQDDNQAWNYETPASTSITSQPQPAVAPMGFMIQVLHLSESSIHVTSAANGMNIHRSLDAELQLTADRALRDIMITGWLRSGNLNKNDTGAAALDLEVRPRIRVSVPDSTLEIVSLEFQMQDLIVDMQGHYRLENGIPVGTLRTQSEGIELASIMSLVPESIRGGMEDIDATGRADIDLTIQCFADKPVDLSGSLQLSGGRVSSKHWTQSMENIRVDAKLADGELHVSHAQANIGSSHIEVKGEIQSLLEPNKAKYALTTHANLLLEDFKGFLVLPPLVQVQGKLQFALEVQGNLNDPTSLELQGPLTIEAGVLETPDLPSALRFNAQAQFLDQRLDLTEAQVKLDGEQARIHGTIWMDARGTEPQVDLFIQSKQINLDALLLKTSTVSKSSNGSSLPSKQAATSLLPPPTPMVTSVTIDIDQAQFQLAVWRQARIKLLDSHDGFELSFKAQSMNQKDVKLQRIDCSLHGDSASAQGLLRIANARMGQLHCTNLKSDISIVGTQVRLDSLQAQAYKGQVQGGIELDLSHPGEPTYVMNIAAVDVSTGGLLNDFVHTGDWIQGRIQVNSSWSAQGAESNAWRQSLTASGQGHSIQGSVQDLPALSLLSGFMNLPKLKTIQYRDMQFTFEVQDGKLHLPHLQLHCNQADMNLSGFVGLDGRLDMKWHILLSESISQQYASHPQLGALQSLFANEEGRMVFDFDLTGDARHPSLKPDLTATVARPNLRSLADIGVREFLGKDQSLETLKTDAVKQATDAIGKHLRRGLGGFFNRQVKPDSTQR